MNNVAILRSLKSQMVAGSRSEKTEAANLLLNWYNNENWDFDEEGIPGRNDILDMADAADSGDERMLIHKVMGLEESAISEAVDIVEKVADASPAIFNAVGQKFPGVNMDSDTYYDTLDTENDTTVVASIEMYPNDKDENMQARAIAYAGSLFTDLGASLGVAIKIHWRTWKTIKYDRTARK